MLPSKLRCLPVVLAAVLAAAAATPAVAAAVSFPVRHSPNARYLVDANNQPFPILGRTAWFLYSLTPEEQELFFADTLKRQYNALEFLLVGRDPRGNHVPFDSEKRVPFLKRLDGQPWDGSFKYTDINRDAPDFSTPNEEYWKGIDDLLKRTAERGFLVLVFPAYVGYGGDSEQGWLPEMVANGRERMRAYAEFVGRRYRAQSNIVWMLGGDHGGFNPPQVVVEQALVDGLRAGGAGGVPKQWTAEWQSETIGTDDPDFGKYMTLNSTYTFDGYTAHHTRRSYAHTPVRPSFLLEEPYDEEHVDGTNVNKHASQPVRRFQWWGWLGSIGGYMSGNGYVWPFNAGVWQQHLDTRGARDMAHLNAFIRSIPWYDLVPSGLGGQRELVVKGGSADRAPDYVAAAATLDGRLLVVYSPPDRWYPWDVDLRALRGPGKGRWFDPTSGEYKEIPGVLSHKGPHTFKLPGENSAGEMDWVLVIEAEPEVAP